MMDIEDKIVEHYDELLAYSNTLTKDPIEAEDLVQESIIRALQYAESYDERGYMRAWLYRIVWSQFVNQFNKEQRRQKTPDYKIEEGTHPPDNGTVLDELARKRAARKQVATIKDQLPAKYFDLLMGHARGRTYKQLAEEFDIPLGTVMSRIFRARSKAKAILEGGAPSTKGEKFIAVAPDGTEYRPDSQTSFAEVHGLNQRKISECLRGNQKTHKGWKFKELE